ncbi:MAG: EF-hand domain-containing protein, partial [Planctomycetaceae bacterium]|nr:EF-hand domain-containing protein [Planctomycetaceae bacterium]
TSAEYLARYPTQPNAPRDFAARDRDGDGALNSDEYADPQFPQAYNDPIELFRRADADCDGRVSVDELSGVAQAHQQMLPALMIPAFDDDGDGLLTLSEFRVSMLGNTICGWHTTRTDKNRDGVLTFDEFLFQPDDFLLLQRLYFYRFDADGDGRLIQSEFPYVEFNPNTLYRLAADGSSMEMIWQDKSRPTAGSPEISPDGKWIAFDLYPEGKIMMVRSDGDILTEVRGGLMPSWSVDGKSFAYSQSGVSISDFNGHHSDKFANGWGAQWSPDGKLIAYTMNRGLWVYDVASETSREVLPHNAHPYATLYYGMTWSPDSRYLAIKATSGNVHDIIRIDTQGEKPAFDVLLSTTLSLSHDLTWSPDGERLLFSMNSPQHGRNLLHQLELQDGASPTVFPGIDTNLTYMCQSFSRDGTWIVLTAK